MKVFGKITDEHYRDHTIVRDARDRMYETRKYIKRVMEIILFNKPKNDCEDMPKSKLCKAVYQKYHTI